MRGNPCAWDSVGCTSLDVDGLTGVLACAMRAGCGLSVECGERVLEQLLEAARLNDRPAPRHCVWSATWDRDWLVARRAVSCSGQAGCRRSADCVTQAQALLLHSARRLVIETLARG